ncbi:MAG: TonB family protein [Candidatus Acidiferrales bacterium]
MKKAMCVCAVMLGAVLAVSAAAQEQSGQPKSVQEIPPPPNSIRVGGKVAAANLVHQVMPVYPQIAKLAHIEGTVVLHAIIDEQGDVEELQFVSGPPMLMQAAMDAVRQWKYRPTLIDGQPVKVDTTISVVFTLDGNVPGAEQKSAPAQKAVPEGNPPPDWKPAEGEIPAAEQKPIDPQLKADILKMLDVTHMIAIATEGGRKALEKQKPVFVASLPPTPHREEIADAFGDKVMALFKLPEFTDQIVAVYAKYFSDEDIRALTQFYETPAGQHYNAVIGQMLEDLTDAGQRAAADNLPRIFQELCQEYPELQGEAKFCPSDSQKKGLLMEREPSFPSASPSAIASR